MVIILHIKFKGNHKCSQMVATGLTLGMGFIGQNSTFSEHGHLHINLNGIIKCSCNVANILPPDPPVPIRQKVRIHIFQNNVIMHIKLNGNTNAATWSQIIFPQTTLPWVGVKRSQFNFFRTWSCCISK